MKLIPNFSPFDPLTLRKEVDLHLISFRNKLSIFFSAAQSSMSYTFTHMLGLVNNRNFECNGNTFQPLQRIWGGSKRAGKWWLNSYIPASSLWLANGKKLVKTFFSVVKPALYIVNTVSTRLLSSFIKEGH